MTAIRSNITCFVALVLADAAACAGDTAQPAPPTTGGDSFFERATLTDDWFSTGLAMHEHGIHFTGAIFSGNTAEQFEKAAPFKFLAVEVK